MPPRKISNKITFDEFKTHYKWKRVMKDTDIRALAGAIFKKLNNGEGFGNDYIYKDLVKYISDNKGNYKSFPYLWKQIGEKTFITNNIFYRPIDKKIANKKLFRENIDVPYGDNLNEKFIVLSKYDNTHFKKHISDIDKDDDIITVIIKDKPTNKNKPKEEPPKTEAPKEEPSLEEQLKNTITKIAKDKSLMNLSKEQLRDYLRDAYGISDENALNTMMNAVVAKRAELLANGQLKQEELTEIDIGKLQEQSQRDFEKKLNDQNLRYILPAQIEKRERLVQNRLNPELLKGGY